MVPEARLELAQPESRGILNPLCLPISPLGQYFIAIRFGAGNETRTRDPNLGKVVLYQLSYSRFILHNDSLIKSSAVNFTDLEHLVK